MKLFTVDNSEPITLEDFIKINTAENVHSISDEEIQIVKNLKLNESVYIGMCDVKRIR